MEVSLNKYVVHFRESGDSPQWEDIFDNGTEAERKAQAERRAFDIFANGGIAVVVAVPDERK